MTMGNQENTKREPTQAGQYYLLEKIAQGGMAEIYKGLSYDINGLKKTVCIKRILPEITANQEFVDSLIDEAKIAVKLSHGNIAQIYDLGKVDDEYFMVMEYVDGRTLSQLMRSANKIGYRIPLAQICYIISEIANGLDYIHRKNDDKGQPLNIVHCDISPQNIMISLAGTVKIIDFGIAKAAIKKQGDDAGILKGKFSYMSPEQAMGEPIDHRSDIYSLGIIMHEMLTGKRLFKANDKKETLRNVRESKVAPPSLTKNDIPEEIDRIALRALAKDRRFRFPLASEMRDELQKYLHMHYHEFMPSQLTTLLHDIFGKDLTTAPSIEAELKTPHMIIDHTRSAILLEEEKTGKEPAEPDMQKFMIEEAPEEAPEGEKTPQEKEKHPAKRNFKPALFFITMLIVIAIAVLLTEKNKDKDIQVSVQIPKEETVSPRTAFLKIESTPSGATVFLDDHKTDFKTPITLEGLEPDKEHALGLWLENYKYWSKKFLTKSGGTKTFNIELSLDFGSLKIITHPKGAKAYMDGEEIGVTPIDKKELNPGKIHRIELKLEGYLPFIKEIKVKPGKEELMRAKMEKEK